MLWTEIPEADKEQYLHRLIPRLSMEKAGKWVSIDLIARDRSRFIEIVMCLTTQGIFDDCSGCCLIELADNEMAIRVRPDAIRDRDILWNWKKERLWK